VKNLPVFALPAVEADLRAAMAHYASWRSDGATHLKRKYEETVSWIGWNPEGFPKKYGSVRRAILKQSHYIVYFSEEKDRILILGVVDGRRNPLEIRRLVRDRKRPARR
jgi:plasmid stabilization system protein ParE